MEKKGFKTIAQAVTVEVIEKKSRFICTLIPIITEEQAISFIEEKRAKHWDASHNCYAYIVGSQPVMRYSDDGEPSGTAGQPMLSVLQKEGLSYVVAVVTRYFGGTLLGAGGLVRAYSKSVVEAVKASVPLTFCDCQKLTLACEYPLLGKLQNEIHAKHMLVEKTAYTERVHLELWVPRDELARVRAVFVEVTNGQIDLHVGESAWIGVDIEGKIVNRAENM